MSAIYDNWERLVAAVLKKQQLWQLFHDHSRSPSVLSGASDFSSSFSSRYAIDDLTTIDFARLRISSRSERSFSKLVFVSDFSPAIEVNDVYLSSSKLLGRGAFGSSYTAAMGNGVSIVVKKLQHMSISETEFNQHMAIVAGVKHKNVVALRAYYSSENQRLMLYDYCKRGSVYTLLHGRKNGEPRAHVDWESRLKIAVGAAWGIAEIHKHNGGKLVHGNIKASNVFCNPDSYGCVSDLGPTNIMETTFIPTSHYYDPQAKKNKTLSQASDVYSFGILLLELLTRKPTVHVPGGPEAVDLIKLVTSIRNKVWAANAFDSDQLKDPTAKDDMVRVFQIGMKCVEKSIKKRPKMSEVVKMLEKISVLNPIRQNFVARKLICIEDANNPKYILEDMLAAPAEMIGKGTFGTSYKATLADGNTVMVKNLRGVSVTFIDFQQHMEIIGRMRHKNIAQVRAYLYMDYEKLLVYDHYYRDSLSVLLHGKIGTVKTFLDWETRMKIAVGTARGIAHIHRENGEKLVHGNIKSSNIFLDRENYGIISDVGLAKLMSPVGETSLLTPGYLAPEVTKTKRVSQASDTYSFGVLLFELLSGKPSQTTTDNEKVICLVESFKNLDRDEWADRIIDSELPRDGNVAEMMIQLLQIAMDCVSDYPEQRPKMSQVVRMLEEYSGVESSEVPILEETWEKPLSIESRLEDLLEDLLPILTP